MKLQMEQGLEQQGREEGGINIEETEERTYVVRGEEQTAVIGRGSSERGDRIVQVFLPFTAKSGNPAMLMSVTPEEQWEADLNTILQSMNGESESTSSDR